MTTLADQLKKALALDDDHLILDQSSTYEGHGGMLYLSVPVAISRANKHLAPIHEALIECALQLQHMIDDDVDQPELALAKLTAALEGK